MFLRRSTEASEDHIPSDKERAKPHGTPEHSLSGTFPLARPFELLVTLPEIFRREIRVLDQLINVLALLLEIRMQCRMQFRNLEYTPFDLPDLIRLIFVMA